MRSSDDSARGVFGLLRMPKLLLFLTALLALGGALGLSKLRNEDDVLVFLPEGEPEVVTFKEAARRFGAMRVALIGVKPQASRDGGELFTFDMLSRIGRLSDALKNTQGVDRVVSLSTMTDLKPSELGVEIRPLLPSPLPNDSAELLRLKKHSLELPQVRGNVISDDGSAALVLVFLNEGSKTQPLADKARTLARAELGDVSALYFGGAPFAGQAIYDDTQHDVRRLTPLAIILFFVVVLLAFRGWLPVLLTVATVALAGVLVLGGMGLWGEAFTVVTGTLPLILFASGSQYAIHILGRYYMVRDEQIASGRDGGPLAAAVAALRIAGPPVTVAAINCCLGFLSFAVMNIRAMRTFGYACSFGVLFCLLFAVTVLPAVVARWEPAAAGRGEAGRHVGLGRFLLRGFHFARRRRLLVGGVTLVLAILCAGGMTRVQVRMEPRAFFRPGSEPEQAQRFLDNTFGGAQFAQILVEGDMTDPRSLAELRRLTEFARALPNVTQVQSVIEPLSLVGDAMAGLYGLPSTQAQVGTLLFFMAGEPSLRMLLSDDRKAALIHVRLLGDAQPVLRELERYLQSRWPFALRAPTVDELTEELTYFAPKAQREARREAMAAAVRKVMQEGLNLGGPPPAPPPPPSEDSADLPIDDGGAAEVKRARAAQVAAKNILIEAMGAQPTADLSIFAAGLLQLPQAQAGGEALRARLTGEPMLDRGFSRAVERNQWWSLLVALSAVLIAILIANRSLWAALLSLLPAVMALAVVFGTLGFVGQPIDLGTSLVGSIVTSSGADFAMHYIWYLRRRSADEVVPSVGPVIFTTAALLGLGMGVMMLGGAPPIRLFGGLACAGMLLSAAFTFLLVPALLPLPAHLAATKKESR